MPASNAVISRSLLQPDPRMRPFVGCAFRTLASVALDSRRLFASTTPRTLDCRSPPDDSEPYWV